MSFPFDVDNSGRPLCSKRASTSKAQRAISSLWKNIRQQPGQLPRCCDLDGKSLEMFLQNLTATLNTRKSETHCYIIKRNSFAQ
jgi:hypothetical protein